MAIKGFVTGTFVLLALAILPFVSSDYYRGGSSHNLIIGRYNYGDRLLYHTNLNVPSKWFRSYTYDIKYPTYGRSTANITYISVIDKKNDGTGGYPSLIQGGIGYRNVTIRIKSQTSHGLHFNVTIYGR